MMNNKNKPIKYFKHSLYSSLCSSLYMSLDSSLTVSIRRKLEKNI